MKKFHVTPDGPRPCSARVRACPLGGQEVHFSTLEEAQASFEKKMQEKFAPTLTKANQSALVNTVDDDLELPRFELIQYANQDPANLAEIQKTIDIRADNTVEMFKRLREISPFNTKSNVRISRGNFFHLRDELNSYRDRTGEMVEAEINSQFYKSKCFEYEGSVGKTIQVSSLDPQSEEWLLSRKNTMGGSDVATLVVMDFTSKDDQTSFDRRHYRELVAHKSSVLTPEEIEKIKKDSMGGSGALYRGTVWEDRIRTAFAEDHPKMKVYNTKDQYRHPSRNWQVANFDGLIAENGRDPNAILEIKTTGSPDFWSKGVPLGYRAQTLYYLNSTGYDKAYVRVCINDRDHKDFILHRNDEVAPGSGVTMEQYIKTRVDPWFKEIGKS